MPSLNNRSRFKQRLALLAAALALSFALPASTSLAAPQKGAAAGQPIWVVDPSPVNWLWITWNTMEELVRVDKDGKPEMGLAESYKWIDPKTVEFKLRKNVVFQDGEKLNAKVFRRSFDEVQRWDNPHPPGAFLNFAKGTKLDIIDDHTVRFTFPQTDSAAMMKFRGMHVGSTKFWDELSFIDKKTGKAEGHW